MSFVSQIISPELLSRVLDQYALSIHGVHGLNHWQQVERNALELARHEGVNSGIFPLFALFHDACRQNDGRDPDHGKRGGELARLLHGRYYSLSAEDLERLCYACSHHTCRTHHSDPVIGVCWDADRLDLPRVGIIPDARYLNTETGKAKLH